MVGEDGGRGWWERMVGEDGGRGWWERMVGEDGGSGDNIVAFFEAEGEWLAS